MDFICDLVLVILLFSLAVFIFLALIYGVIMMTLSFFSALRDVIEEIKNKKI